MKHRIAKLTRVTHHQDGQLLFFTMEAVGRKRAARDFVQPEHVPEFEGDEAWFELERVPATPWPYWRAVRQVDGPRG